jgi:hypothetical protein
MYAMYIFNYLVAFTISLWGCGHLNSEKASQKVKPQTTDTVLKTISSRQYDSFYNRVYFSKSDAELILGEKAYLSDSSSITKKDTLEIKSAYTANSIDQQTGKTGIIYFMIEEYSLESSAKDAYHFFKSGNEKHEGLSTIHNMGDEAYFHSDGTNFYFILVRKGKKMFRMKVNKITSHTSLSGFNRVSKKISDAL